MTKKSGAEVKMGRPKVDANDKNCWYSCCGRDPSDVIKVIAWTQFILFITTIIIGLLSPPVGYKEGVLLLFSALSLLPVVLTFVPVCIIFNLLWTPDNSSFLNVTPIIGPFVIGEFLIVLAYFGMTIYLHSGTNRRDLQRLQRWMMYSKIAIVFVVMESAIFFMFFFLTDNWNVAGVVVFRCCASTLFLLYPMGAVGTFIDQVEREQQRQIEADGVCLNTNINAV